MASCDVLLERIRLQTTSYREKGKRVHVRAEPDESIAFYRTDHPHFRRQFGLGKATVSDLAVDVNRPQASSRTVFFIELKGRHVDRAIDPLASTISAVRMCILKEAPNARLRAVVVSSGSAPKMLDRPLKDFRRKKRRGAETFHPIRSGSARPIGNVPLTEDARRPGAR